MACELLRCATHATVAVFRRVEVILSRSVGERLPSFLIIGAQKSGTTTLYRDLYDHPDVFLPEFKEPNALCADDVLQGEGRRTYARLFAPAAANQICGEASTAYTKWPDFTSVPRRARELLGPDLKLIYITRDPIVRITSQYAHEFDLGRIDTDIERAVREVPRLINYSRYAMQVLKWLEYFPQENLRLLRLEDYSRDRVAGLKDLWAFLQLRSVELEAKPRERHNSSEARLTPSQFWEALLHDNPFYRLYIQPYVPRGLRRAAAQVLFKKAQTIPTEMSEETIALVEEALREDAVEFERLWNAQAARMRPAASAPG